MAGTHGLKENGDLRISSELKPDEEFQASVDRKCGGWNTFPFIAVALLGLTIAAAGWMSNLIVYLIELFNINNIDAAQISNVASGCSHFFPIVGAIVADSWLGIFSVISISSIISLLGVIMLTLTATVKSLTPSHCEKGSSKCEPSTTIQLTVLYMTIFLVSVGMGGTRFSLSTMGANQFDKAKVQETFFNWYFFILYFAQVIGYTGIVYIQDNLGWGLGFGLCVAANSVGLAFFLSGKTFYRRAKSVGSPYTSLARVVIASMHKRKLSLSSTSHEYYFRDNGEIKSHLSIPSSSFRFLNRAALNTEGNMHKDDSIARPWRLCTIQQVEDLKTLIRILPLWSSSIFLSTPIGVQGGLVVLQALTMNRHIGPHFQVPAGTFSVFTLLSSAIFITIIDRFIAPMWQNIVKQPITPLQRIGFGHILNILGMAMSALIESKRLHVVKSHHILNQVGLTVPLSAMWLVLPLAIVGIGEAFHFPGQVAFYYQEFPKSLSSTSAAMVALVLAMAYFLSTSLIDLIRRITAWLPDNINNGRLDNVFWVLVVLGIVNFLYYLTCTMFYKYKNNETPPDDDPDVL